MRGTRTPRIRETRYNEAGEEVGIRLEKVVAKLVGVLRGWVREGTTDQWT